jgi:hypothetical protein
MPRVSISAWAFVVAACLAGLPAPLAAQPAGPRAAAGDRRSATPASGHARAADAEAQRREEIDALQRQDIAEALRLRFGINVDWRTTPMDRLIDIRLRAAKAADLQARLGVSVDWQRYSWVELEALRRTLLSFEAGGARDQPLPPPSVDQLVQPRFKPAPARPELKTTRAADPDAIIRPTFTARPEPRRYGGDPDAVIRPTFAARPVSLGGVPDPDGLITPTFAPRRRFVSAAARDPDDLIAPLEPGASPPPVPVPSPVSPAPPVRWAPPAPPVPLAPPAPARW